MTLVEEHINKIMERLSEAISKVDPKKIQRALFAISRSDRVFFVGVGRSGYAAKFAAHRLAHLGFRVYVVGETITPAATPHDTLVAISGSGETQFTINIAEKAKSLGAYVVAITSNEKSKLAKISNTLILIPSKRESLKVGEKDFLIRQIIGTYEPFGEESGIFELAAMIVLEAIIRGLVSLKKQSSS